MEDNRMLKTSYDKNELVDCLNNEMRHGYDP